MKEFAKITSKEKRWIESINGWISKSYNKKVLERPLGEGDLVLRRTTATGKAHDEGKLTANWEGPYVITKKLALGSIFSRA